MKKLATLTLLALLWSPVEAEPELDRWIGEAQKRYSVPGVAVAVVRKGQVTHLQGYGVRSTATLERVDADTVFQLASVSKPLTATALARQVERGVMDWDTPVNHYFPEMRLAEPFATAHVSLRDFLTHRSGLPAFTGDLVDELGETREWVYARLEQMPLSNGFRNKPGYNNLGITAAGLAGARMAGTSFEELMQKEVFAPLQMRNTGFIYGKVRAGQNIAWPHGNGRAWDELDQSPLLAPAGAVTSTASDLSKWMLALLEPKKDYLKAETIREVFRPIIEEHIGFAELPPISEQSGFSYALGWNVYYYNGHKIMEKGGARYGMRSLVTLIPDRGVGVATLTNLNLNSLPEAIRAHVLEQELGPWSGGDVQQAIWDKQKQTEKLFASIGEPPPPPQGPTSLPLERYQGTYRSALYGDMKIALKDGSLHWTVGKKGFGSKLVAIAFNSFFSEPPKGKVLTPMEFTFLVDGEGKPTRLFTEGYGSFDRL